jgi:uncharacterized protein (DUF952 family)
VDAQRVYKICPAADWEAAARLGQYAGSADDHRDGFIHLSTGAQVARTLGKHFAGREGLLLVAFDAESLGAGLRYEGSAGGTLYPHLYGLLPTAAAHRVMPLPLGPDGRHILPEDVS